VAADGNCCYRASSLALYGVECHHLLVRLLTALELLENQPTYDGDSPTRHSELFSTAIPHSPFKNLIDDVCKPGAYAELAHIYAISAAYGVVIQSYMPTMAVSSQNNHYTRAVV
jgi:hypothetical protein